MKTISTILTPGGDPSTAVSAVKTPGETPSPRPLRKKLRTGGSPLRKKTFRHHLDQTMGKGFPWSGEIPPLKEPPQIAKTSGSAGLPARPPAVQPGGAGHPVSGSLPKDSRHPAAPLPESPEIPMGGQVDSQTGETHPSPPEKTPVARGSSPDSRIRKADAQLPVLPREEETPQPPLLPWIQTRNRKIRPESSVPTGGPADVPPGSLPVRATPTTRSRSSTSLPETAPPEKNTASPVSSPSSFSETPALTVVRENRGRQGSSRDAGLSGPGEKEGPSDTVLFEPAAVSDPSPMPSRSSVTGPMSQNNSLTEASRHGSSPPDTAAVDGLAAWQPSVPADSGSPEKISPAVPDFSRKVLEAARQGGGEVTLRVHPPALGPVQVSVHLDGGGRTVSLSIHVRDESVRKALISSGDTLRKRLEREGFSLGRMDVSTLAPAGNPALPVTGGAAPTTDASSLHMDPGGGGSPFTGRDAGGGGTPPPSRAEPFDRHENVMESLRDVIAPEDGGYHRIA
ncbi:MAG: flagellar hook-length control protein FliK [Leptospirillum sp.]